MDRISWKWPPPLWTKLNTDGSKRDDVQSAAGGGLLRDAAGAFIYGFSNNYGDISITIAELLALRDGLQMAWSRRIPKIQVKVDSEVVLKLFLSSDTWEHPLHNVLGDCRQFKRLSWEFAIAHTKREGNACDDYLAKLGHYTISYQLWTDLPLLLMPFLANNV
ncbi:hypothetical protein OROHE_010459 [Orobanche hederae]